MATDSVTVSPTFNGDSVPLTAGMIVRLKPGANNNVVRAQSDSSAHVQGTCGVVVSGSCAPGGVVIVSSVGRQTVQIENGLTPGVGDTVYVSATVPGKGTNVIPGVVLPIGSIADISNYARLGTVEVDVVAAASEAGAGGTFPGFGGAPPAVAAASSGGAAGTASRSDHTHAGVTSLNAEQGAIALESTGATVSITTPDSGHINLEVANPLPAFATPADLGPNEGVAGVASTIIRSDAIPGQKIRAAWPIANVRWYAVDGVNGNDANAGFSDVSEADAGTKAKKTIAGLAAIFPTVGNGRKVSISIANGGVNTAQTYAESIDALTFGVSGYSGGYTLKATGTNSNAGAVAFDGSANTDVYCGGVTVTGLNAAGYNPTGGATTTAIPCQLNGGGAAALPAEPAAPLGWRIRFDINTATVALRGICKEITQVQSSQVNVNNALSTPPSTSDVFYIEQAGVNISTTVVNLSIGAGTPNGVGNSPAIGGFNFTGQLNVFPCSGATPTLCFSACTGVLFAQNAVLNSQRFYTNVASGSARSAGGGLRNNGGFSQNGWANSTQMTCYTQVGTNSFSIESPSGLSALTAGAFATGLIVWGGGMPSDGNTPQIGSADTTAPTRILGPNTDVTKVAGLTLRGVRGNVDTMVITGVGAHPAIALVGTNQIVFGSSNSGGVSGSTGNTDVGLDLTQAEGSTVVLATIPTVTGTNGDVRLSDGTIVSWATAAAGLVDTRGNTVYALGNAPLGTKVASAATAVALGNVAPGTVTSSTPTVWTPLVINGVKYLVPLWPST